jgi:hypothetical protein
MYGIPKGTWLNGSVGGGKEVEHRCYSKESALFYGRYVLVVIALMEAKVDSAEDNAPKMGIVDLKETSAATTDKPELKAEQVATPAAPAAPTRVR